jgi:L-seryl-tRNA(Ser) seleniumtransferase
MTSIDRQPASASSAASAMRALPSVHRLAAARGDIKLPRPVIIDRIRRHLDAVRTQLAADAAAAPPAEAELISALRASLEQHRGRRIRPVINATGIIVHTNFGRSPLSKSARGALLHAARNYTNLEYDLAAGERGGRAAYLEQHLALLCGAEAATIVNNCAAALVLMLHHFTARPPRTQVLVSRGELVQIGGGFRVPEILQASGAVLREVGTTNKTTLDDYRNAIDAQSAMLLRVHRSNFYMSGFVESPTTADLAGVAHSANLPLIEDLGSGATFDTTTLGGGEREPIVAEALAAGADLVCFSGDKLLGGPQAGIIAGRAEFIAALKKLPILRALRCDKLVLSALQATVDELLAGRESELPIRGMAGADPSSLRARAENIVAKLHDAGVTATIGQGESRIGGGSLPRTVIPSVTVDLSVRDPQHVAAALRTGEPPVIAYVADNMVKLDLRTVFPDQDRQLLAAIRSAFAPVAAP